MKKIVITILALIMAISVIGCGNNDAKNDDYIASSKEATSKTAKAFNGITLKTGLHMNVEVMVKKSKVRIDLNLKDDDFYIKSKTSGEEVIMINNADGFYTLSPSLKSGTKSDDSDTAKAMVKFKDRFDEFARGNVSKEETKKIDDKTYAAEVFENGDDQAIFCFDGNKLCYIIQKIDNVETQIKIYVLDGNVDSKLFEVPTGYDITETSTSDKD